MAIAVVMKPQHLVANAVEGDMMEGKARDAAGN